MKVTQRLVRDLYYLKACNLYVISTGVSRQNPQGGGVFFRFFLAGLAKIKTPPPGGFRKFQALDFVSAAKMTHNR